MRAVYWQTRFHPEIGGAESFGRHLIRALSRRGVTFLAIASHGTEPIPDVVTLDGTEIHRFPFVEALQRRDLPRIAETRRSLATLLDAFRPDLVHLNSLDASPFFLRHARRPLPTLLTVHSSATFGPEPNSLLRRVVAGADHVVAVSRAMWDDVLSFAPEVAGRSSHVPNAVERPPGEPPPLDLAAPLVLGLGRLVPEKGFDVLIDAFVSIAGRHPAARLAILGDGPSRAALFAQAGPGARIEVPGWCLPEDVTGWIDRAAVVAVPSTWREPFGLVALEAAQRGRPVVASAVGGLPQIVADGETGLLVAPGDRAALAAALDSLLSDGARAQTMGEAARRRAATVFDVDRFADVYYELYSAVARRGVR